MRFTVFAFSTTPDIETARRNFQLADLSEKEVAKVLFHQRKQQTGHSERLNWDQLQIASTTLVKHSLDHVELQSHTLADLSEPELIGRLFEALEGSGRLVSWNGNSNAMPLLHFRCMKHQVSHAGYWQAVRDGRQVHTDLRDIIAPTETEMPPLDAFAQRFGYPGMLGHDIDTVWDAFLEKNWQEIARFSDYWALNSYLLALDLMTLRGEMDQQDTEKARLKLRERLEKQAAMEPRYQSFLDAWRSER